MGKGQDRVSLSPEAAHREREEERERVAPSLVPMATTYHQCRGYSSVL